MPSVLLLLIAITRIFAGKPAQGGGFKLSDLKDMPLRQKKDSILEIDNLVVTYQGSAAPVQALRNVSFHLGPGETMGIIGESGSGKTTLALAMLGLIDKPHLVTGRVCLEGRDLLALTEEAKNELRWSKMAMVFQNSLEILNPVLTIGEQIAEPLRRHQRLSGGELEAELRKLFTLVGLEYFWKDAYPHQLSGGMRQRVLLAMGLSCQPAILVVDEPTTSLDAIAKKEILGMLKSLQEEIGFSMIIISHDLAAMESLAERLLVLYDGETLESGPTTKVIETPRHPYTRGLINASVEIHPHKDLWGIRGERTGSDHDTNCSFAGRCTQEIDICRQERPCLSMLPDGEDQRFVRCHRGGIVTILEAELITKHFTLGRRKIEALQGVDIKLFHGETSALVGTSGSGKSTLAQVMAGFTVPDGGSVLFNGEAVRGSLAARREKGIQLVLQDPFSSISHRLRVANAVGEPLKINRLGGEAEQSAKIREAMQAVQLPGDEYFLQRFCHTLSGGQRQRLAIARALVMRPALLIADEITSMLDVSTQANLLRMLKGLQYNYGFTMLYITHDLHLARKVAERIIVLHQGKVIEEGPAKKVTEEACCGHTHDLMEAGLHRHYHYHEHDHRSDREFDHAHAHIHKQDHDHSS
jgi:peptide/nickel transport system ATP-binding protein